MSLPRWVRVLVRRGAPPEFSADLLDDLADGFAGRRQGGGLPWRWLLTELARTPWIGLWRQARRMRAAGTRREMPASPGGGMTGWGAGLRIAARALRKRPSYAAVAVATLAVSIGSATLIFSVLEGVLLRPLPYTGGDRIHQMFATNEAWRDADQEVLRQSWDRLDLTQDMLSALRQSIPGAEALGAYTPATLRLDDGLDPVQLPGARAVPGFFDVLALPPLAGRLPSDAELASGAAVVVLSERLWTSRYGRDPEVLGRTVSLAGRPHTVVGVLPGAFAVPSELARWWSPLPPDFAGGRTDAAVFKALVRLAPGADPDVAEEGVARVGSSLAESNARYAGMGVRLRPLADLLVDDVREGLTLLFLAVVVVVLIASVNLANLMVARGSRRRGELAMRAALGASRRDLVWSMLSETLLVCTLGGGLGVLAATQLLDPFVALLSRASPGFPRADDVGVNGVVLLFSTGVAVLTALVAGVGPALAASRRSPWEALQHGGRSRGGRATRRTQRTLLLVEATLAMLLLAVAGLLTRSALNVAAIDPGYDSQAVAYLEVEVPAERYGSDAEALALGNALEGRLARLPGVTSVARASGLPGLGGADGKLLWPVGGTMESASLIWSTGVTPGYFQTMGIPLLEGRTFAATDGPDDPPVAVVSELFARRFFPGQDPVGRTVMMGTGTRMEGGSVVADGQVELTVVGLVADVRQLAVVMEPDPGVYLPLAQRPDESPHLVFRTVGPPRETLEAARAQIRAEDPTLLVAASDVLHASMRRLIASLEVRLVLIVALAVLAAFLTVVGIYGVVAYVVSDQVHEIGVRMALGARSAGESSRLVGQALGPVAVGSVLGLGGAWAASGLVESGLFGVEPLDPLTYAAVLVLLLGVAAGAAWLPARRAASVDPMRVLTEE